MEKYIKQLIVSLLLLATISLHAQTATYHWFDETCEYESTFDSLKISREQISNAYSLVMIYEFRIQNTPSVFHIEDISGLNIDTFEVEYKNKKSKLLTLNLPKQEKWAQFKKAQIAEMEQVYNLSKISYSAYMTQNYSVLNQFNKKDSCLNFYTEALNKGGESLLNAWHHLTIQQANKNCCPEKIWEQYKEERNSSDKYLYAKTYIMTYGWWNCANKYVEYFKHENAVLEFKKLFINSHKVSCDEP